MISKMVGLHKVSKNAITPERVTEKSACYDLFVCLSAGNLITFFDEYNNKYTDVVLKGNNIALRPKCRYILPSGCKFLIPEGYSIRVHPRSGLAIKSGIYLSNCEGIIDEDYPEQTRILITNSTMVDFEVTHGDRLAQIELSPSIEMLFEDIDDFGQITDRVSGLGSTGVKA